MVNEGQHRVKPEAPLEVRGRAFLLRMRPDQRGIQIDHDLDRCSESASDGPRPWPARAARAARIAVITAAESSPRASISRLIVGSEATAPNNSGWARTTATSARQSPPSAIVTARSSTVLPGSCTDRAGRHGRQTHARAPPPTTDRRGLQQHRRPADEISDSRNNHDHTKDRG